MRLELVIKPPFAASSLLEVSFRLRNTKPVNSFFRPARLVWDPAEVLKHELVQRCVPNKSVLDCLLHIVNVVSKMDHKLRHGHACYLFVQTYSDQSGSSLKWPVEASNGGDLLRMVAMVCAMVRVERE